MNILYQIGIIFSICWVSQIVEKLLPFDFPASVIGMVLLFVLLSCKILKVEHIREKSDFLLANMAFFFIPAGVSILDSFAAIQNDLLPILLVIVLSTLITALVTGGSICLITRFQKRRIPR